MPSSNSSFQVSVSVDKSQVDAGFDATAASASTWKDRMVVIATEASSQTRRQMALISEESKANAESLSADQLRVGETGKALIKARMEESAATKLMKGPLGEATETTALLATTQLQAAAAARENAAAIRAVAAAAAQDSAAKIAAPILQNAASSGGGANDALQVQAAAQTRALAAAKAELASITEASAAANLDEDTTNRALAAGQANVAAAEAELATTRGLLKERSEAAAVALREEAAAAAEVAEAERATAAVEAAAGAAGADEKSMKLARAYMEKAAAAREVKTVTELVNTSMADEATKAAVLAPALARDRVATIELAEANEALASSQSHVVTGQMAASGAIRSLEGNAGLRAIENFTAKTLGLGPLLQAIFPVVGALAFGELLISGGEKVYELGQKGKEASSELSRGFGEMNEKLGASNDELALTNSKLEDQIGKLSGHPTNGLQTALLEATVQADKLQQSLAADLKTFHELLKQNDVGFFEGLLSGNATTKDTTKGIIKSDKEVEKKSQAENDQYVNDLTAAGKNAQQREQVERDHNARMARIYTDAAAEHRRIATQAKQDEDRDAENEKLAQEAAAANGSVAPLTINRSQNRQEHEDAAVLYDRLAARSKLNAANFSDNKELGQLKQDKAGGKGEDPARAELQGIEATFAELNEVSAKIHGSKLSASDAEQYWAQYLGVFQARSQEAKKVLEEVGRYQAEAMKQSREAVAKIKARDEKTEEEGDKAVPKGMEAMSKWLKEQGEDLNRTGPRWDSYWGDVAKGKEIAARVNEDAALTKIRMDEAAGILRPLAAAQQTAAIHTREHTEALKALEEELAKLEKEAKRDPLTGAIADPKQAAKIENVQNQIAGEKGKGAEQGGKDQAAITNALAKPYLTAFSSIEASWMSAQRSMLSGQKSFTQAMAGMWSGLALDAIGNIEKIGFNWAKHQIAMMAQKQAAVAVNKTTDAAGAAASDSISALSALKQMNHAAAVAAGKAWGAFADIPLVGPELGAVAAAATYAGVMALASFDQGTSYVPRDGVAMIHKGESILPPPQTQVLADALSGNGGAGAGGDLHLHMGGNTIHGTAGPSFAQQLAAHEDHLAGTISRLHRLGKLKLTR